jgi:hypothetical protein
MAVESEADKPLHRTDTVLELAPAISAARQMDSCFASIIFVKFLENAHFEFCLRPIFVFL